MTLEQKRNLRRQMRAWEAFAAKLRYEGKSTRLAVERAMSCREQLERAR